MFVMSDELSHELNQARSLLAGSIRGQVRLKYLSENYRAYFGAEGDLNEQQRREVMAVSEKSAVTAARA